MTTQPIPELVPRREPLPGELPSLPPVATREDVKAINRRLTLERLRYGGMRVQTGFFRCPWPCTQRVYEGYRKRSVERWLADMDKQGWDLKTKVFVNADKRRPAYGYSGDWVAGALLDQVEIPVAAVFQKRKVEMVRIEIPVAS